MKRNNLVLVACLAPMLLIGSVMMAATTKYHRIHSLGSKMPKAGHKTTVKLLHIKPPVFRRSK